MKFPDLSGLPGGPNAPLVTIQPEGVSAPTLDVPAVAEWLHSIAAAHDRTLKHIGYVLMSDDALLELNVRHLQHDTYTDIITFDLAASVESPIEGECYISLERVQDNATSFGVSLMDELYRVMVHGLLHLCGLGDKSSQEADEMRAAEDLALRTAPY